MHENGKISIGIIKARKCPHTKNMNFMSLTYNAFVRSKEKCERKKHKISTNNLNNWKKSHIDVNEWHGLIYKIWPINVKLEHFYQSEHVI